MCAECHSTNLRKNFDVASNTYHTTFSEIDVSCEACHGPGSVHVQLANSPSLFWDRRLGYGLTHLKDSNPDVEIQACAPCHSRRHGISEQYKPGENYYDHYVNGLLHPETYYADGQILDEDYVFGSFMQSMMYHEKVRCTDCHDPHTTRVKFEGNQLCTSCHQHTPAKYDTPAHHRHQVGSTGASCVECHMPETPFMDVDPRRDHSLRVPRPGLSVKIGTPNACTGCHLDPQRIDADKRDKLAHYSQWLAAAREGDEQVRAELERLDEWALETVEQWYGKKERDPRLEYAETLSRAWQRDPTAAAPLVELAQNRRVPGIVRASALSSLSQFPLPESVAAAIKGLRDPDPQVRAVAAASLQGLPTRPLLEHVSPLLHDPIRAVRQQAARTLAGLSEMALKKPEREARRLALDEYRQSLLAHGDQSSAHLSLGILAERERQPQLAVAAYETAIRVQPAVTGPRSNLAALLEQLGQHEQAKQLRLEELALLERDAKLAPNNAAVQYRCGLALYLHGRLEEAESALKSACRIEPREPEFLLALTLLYQKQERWQQALEGVQRLIELRPSDPAYLQLQKEIRQHAGNRVTP
jgi:predicted CXXCH cytochrome family protein